MVYRFGTWFGWLKTGRGDDVYYGDEREHEHEDDVAGDSRCCVDRTAKKHKGGHRYFTIWAPFHSFLPCAVSKGGLRVTEVQALAN